jgi:putative spermidine/putrescine transport system ATP-binding protein
MSFLVIEHLDKSFGPTRVVKDFALSVERGEFVSLLGPSGCGKTTVLRMIAGFETPSAGTISIDGREVTRLRPNQRNVGMVFQAYALFPNLTVADNVAFGLKVKGVTRADRDRRIAEMLGLVGLEEFGDRYPFQLSGGQQQRVALARALAVEPQVLLLDEPLSALDAKIRTSLRDQIREIQRRLGITTIFVTHDQEEALSMSDRVVVMNAGIAEQIATPFEVYNKPASRFVAEFVGTLNLLDARVIDGPGGHIRIGDNDVELGRSVPPGRITLAMRPEIVSLDRAPGRDIVLRGRIDDVHFLGSVIRIQASLAGSPILLDTFNRPDSPPPAPGEEREFSFSKDDLLVLEG